MTPERSLASSKLSKEISDRIAKPHRRHHENERIAVFKALAVAHHEHVHAAPKSKIKRSAKLHHKPREQMVYFDLRIGDTNVNCEHGNKRHANNVRHRRETKITTLGKRPRKRQRQRRGKRKVTGIGPFVHFTSHAGPFPGAHARQKAHQSNTTKIVEPQQNKNDRNGDESRYQALSQITHEEPSQSGVREY